MIRDTRARGAPTNDMLIDFALEETGDLTQIDAAAVLGVSQKTISRWQSGERPRLQRQTRDRLLKLSVLLRNLEGMRRAGAKLRFVRELAGLSIQELAGRLDVSTEQLQAGERGDFDPKDNLLAGVSLELEIPYSWLSSDMDAGKLNTVTDPDREDLDATSSPAAYNYSLMVDIAGVVFGALDFERWTIGQRLRLLRHRLQIILGGPMSHYATAGTMSIHPSRLWNLEIGEGRPTEAELEQLSSYLYASREFILDGTGAKEVFHETRKLAVGGFRRPEPDRYSGPNASLDEQRDDILKAIDLMDELERIAPAGQKPGEKLQAILDKNLVADELDTLPAWLGRIVADISAGRL